MSTEQLNELTIRLDPEQIRELKAAIDRGVADIKAHIDPMPAAYLVEVCGSCELVHTYSAAEITKRLLERELDEPDCATITPLFALVDGTKLGGRTRSRPPA